MSDKQPAGWHIIDDKTPRDNNRKLYIAEIRDGELVAIDCHATYHWDGDHFLYAGDCVAISTPTHWAYQDEPVPVQPNEQKRLDSEQRNAVLEEAACKADRWDTHDCTHLAAELRGMKSKATGEKK